MTVGFPFTHLPTCGVASQKDYSLYSVLAEPKPGNSVFSLPHKIYGDSLAADLEFVGDGRHEFHGERESGAREAGAV